MEPTCRDTDPRPPGIVGVCGPCDSDSHWIATGRFHPLPIATPGAPTPAHPAVIKEGAGLNLSQVAIGRGEEI